VGASQSESTSERRAVGWGARAGSAGSMCREPSSNPALHFTHVILNKCSNLEDGNVAVKLLPCDHEVMGSNLGNRLFQKCRERLRT
jgi:hypothetical protein